MYQTVQEYLEKTAADCPDKLAFADEARQVTFSQFRQDAQRVACAIGRAGAAKQPVAVFMDKSVACLEAMLGVAYSGNFYTVLDVHMPQARIHKITLVLQPVLILTDRTHAQEAQTLAADAQVLIFDEALECSEDQVLLHEMQQDLSEEDTLYVLFTSGSTGTPKGVVITHRAIIHYADWVCDAFPIGRDTVFANQGPFYFALSVFEIFTTLKTGATCHIIPNNLFSFPVLLLKWLEEHQVNTLYWVPSIFCLVANFRALPEVHLPELRLVFFGGEVMPSKQLNMWRREYPDATFVNLYGPTEMTDICTYYIVNRDISDNESLPIGKAAAHMRVMLLDENDHEVPPGQMGELCAASPSLAEGYYREPEKTAQVFVPNPLDPTGKSRIYRTGDLARVDERGDLIFMGRKDFQIKHMGNRIELGEIETAVSALEDVERNCCLYDAKRDKIVLFYTGAREKDTIREALKKALPEYMIPNRIEKLDVMPMNLNGKIDRALLKEKL